MAILFLILLVIILVSIKICTKDYPVTEQTVHISPEKLEKEENEMS